MTSGKLQSLASDTLSLGNISLESRLLLGTGKYPSLKIMQECHAAAETQMVTVALRRISLKKGDGNPDISDYLGGLHILPNTAGCATAAEVMRMAKIASSLGFTHLKVEVIGELNTLLPDPIATIEAVRMLKSDATCARLYLMVYTSDDPVVSQKLVEAGADCVMPAGSAIGSGRGVANQDNIRLILDLLGGKVPVLIDAGIGSASDAALAMELGVDGVLLNTAVSGAENPIMMAAAMKHAVLAGRASFLAGRIPKKLYATASSPEPDRL